METTDQHLRHLFDGDPIFNVYNEDATNLSVGAPGPDLLQQCVDMMKKATNHRLAEEEKENKYYLFQYGVAAGLWEYREELAKFLTRRYGDRVRRENLILTCGATHGLQLLLNTVLSPNGVIFVEEFTYMDVLNAFKLYPLIRIVPVPMIEDKNIVDLNVLEKLIEIEKQKCNYLTNEQKIFWAMFYTIPIFHNPTGTTLPPASCKRLVEIARKSDIMVVCDDVYNLLHYGDGFPPHRLFFYDDEKDPGYKGGNVVSNGSFSKILSPAIRVGWLECSPRIVNIFKTTGILCNAGGVNNYVSGVIASLLQLNIQDNYLDKLVQTYKERLSVLCNVLDNHLPKTCWYLKPRGGFFIWIRLPLGIDSNDFVKWCEEEYRVSAIPGPRFSYLGEAHNFLRVSIAFHKKEVLETAAKKLCEAIFKYIVQSIQN